MESPTPPQTPPPQVIPPVSVSKKSGKFYFGCLGLLVTGMLLLLGLVFIFIATASPTENPLARALNIEPKRLIEILITAVNIFFGFTAVLTLLMSAVSVFRIASRKKEDPLRKSLVTAAIAALVTFLFTLFAWAGTYIYLQTAKNKAGFSAQKPPVVTEPDDTFGLSAPVPIFFDASNAPVDFRKYEVLNYLWDFGDGTSGTGQTISHEYKDKGTANGKFDVTLTVKKLDRATFAEDEDTYKLIVTIANVRPSVTLDAEPVKGNLPLIVSFEAEATDSDGSVTGYLWDLDGDKEFDDGPSSSGVVEATKVSYTYEKPGKYLVAVKVTDNAGEFTIVEKTIEVLETVTPQAVIEVKTEGQAYVNTAYLFSGEKSVSPSGKITKYEWNFGDGGKEASRTSSHAYKTAGTYLVTLTVTDEKGEKGSASTTLNVLASPMSPKAVIETVPFAEKGMVTGVAPFSVIFDAGKSTDPDNNIVDYAWDFNNDGTTDGAGLTVTHVYEKSGTYKAALTVTDASDQTAKTTVTVNVQAQGIMAKITANPSSGSVPLTVTFDASGSAYSAGEIVSYEWDFGDGSPKRLDDAQVSYKYEKVGTFTAKVTAIGKDNARATASMTIAVKPIAVKACITPSHTSGPAPLTVTFTSCSTGTVTKYKWDLDGDSAYDDATGPEVTHTFSAKGTYPVSLEVTDNTNITDTFTVTITAE